MVISNTQLLANTIYFMLIIVMAKVMNLGAHCSECIHYQGIRPFMYCMALQKRITARKTPKYCKHYKKNKI